MWHSCHLVAPSQRGGRDAIGRICDHVLEFGAEHALGVGLCGGHVAAEPAWLLPVVHEDGLVEEFHAVAVGCVAGA